MRKIGLFKEKMLLIECIGLLASYEDFLVGMKANEALHEYLESRHEKIKLEYKREFEKHVQLLYDKAAEQGVVFELPNEILLEVAHDEN